MNFAIFNDDGDLILDGFETEDEAEIALLEGINVGLCEINYYVGEIISK